MVFQRLRRGKGKDWTHHHLPGVQAPGTADPIVTAPWIRVAAQTMAERVYKLLENTGVFSHRGRNYHRASETRHHAETVGRRG